MSDESEQSEIPTRRVSTVNNSLESDSQARVEPLDEGEEEQFPTIRTEAIEAEAEDEETTMLDREQIMRNVARDREELNRRKETAPAPLMNSDDASPCDDIRSKQTRKIPRVTEQTQEMQALANSAFGEAFADDEAVQFPARVDDGGRLVIPTDKVNKANLAVGDLVLVAVRKVDE